MCVRIPFLIPVTTNTRRIMTWLQDRANCYLIIRGSMRVGLVSDPLPITWDIAPAVGSPISYQFPSLSISYKVTIFNSFSRKKTSSKFDSNNWHRAQLSIKVIGYTRNQVQSFNLCKHGWLITTFLIRNKCGIGGSYVRFSGHVIAQ